MNKLETWLSDFSYNIDNVINNTEKLFDKERQLKITDKELLSHIDINSPLSENIEYTFKDLKVGDYFSINDRYAFSNLCRKISDNQYIHLMWKSDMDENRSIIKRKEDFIYKL